MRSSIQGGYKGSKDNLDFPFQENSLIENNKNE